MLTNSETGMSNPPIFGGGGGGLIPPIVDALCFIPSKFLCCGNVGINCGSHAVKIHKLLTSFSKK